MELTVRIDPADEASRRLLEQLAARGADVGPPRRRPGTCLVLGGARSGKSTWAEQQLATCPEVDYVATSEVADDAEWAHRVALHRERRPDHWRTIETTDLASVLAATGSAAVLIDCAALWLDRVLAGAGAWDGADGWRDRLAQEVGTLARAVAETGRDVIIVSNEVGSGIVPETASSRLYRDGLGRLNATLAAVCDEVWLLTAGIPRKLK